MSAEKFKESIEKGYAFSGNTLTLGAGMINGEVVSGATIKVPLRTLNRHGLIAGATGSGKTKTLQLLAEQLSANGVPVLMMDIKGDLSGIAAAGENNPKLSERNAKIGVEFVPHGSPVEFFTLSNEKGARLRATVTEFGPVLFSKILGLNDTQSGVVAVVFKFCDDNQLPLIDLNDFKRVLQFLINEGKESLSAEYGNVSAATVGTILRKVVELEQQGANLFFGELSLDVQDLCRLDENGRGTVNVIRLTDVQDRPKLFSSFMLSLLGEIYATFPEKGDMEQPELVIFIDEAHLVFEEATDTLLTQIETIIKLIRSKGVGIFFCTQVPSDIPNKVLGQLGLKIQHALRAFTANDRKAIKQAAQNYPETEFYVVEDMLTNLGIGEAFVTALNEKGIPTPLAHTLLRAPESRMNILLPSELDAIINASPLVKKYNQAIDPESAYEMLNARMVQQTENATAPKENAAPTKKEKEEPSFFEKMLNNSVTKQIARTVTSEISRGLLGMLGIKKRR